MEEKDPVTEAFRIAFQIGLSPSEFWPLTPWALGQLIESHIKNKNDEHNSRAWMMWHGALLGRIQNTPPLENFLIGKKPVNLIDEEAIMARLEAYQKRVDECRS